MKKDQFEKVVRLIASQRGPSSCRTMMTLLRSTFPDFSENTLRSIFSQEICRKMKYAHGRHKAKGAEYFQRYLEGRATGKSTLLSMASEISLSPALMARVILEAFLMTKNENSEGEGSLSKLITKLLRDTSLIEDRLLAHDVHLCVLIDDQYGPLADAINHSLGQQYEHSLSLQLSQRQIPYLTEDQMRNLGLDKTPDIKLEVLILRESTLQDSLLYLMYQVPVAVDGFIIHWIESKALFGSEEWHDKYVKKQLSTYWNRYGPGMVIYWFDFVDSLQSMHEKHLLVANCLPLNIVMMDPLKRP